MNLSDARGHYEYFSQKASELSRQLAFAGIAIIWIFKTDQNGIQRLAPELALPAIILVAALALDFLQYVYATAAWGCFHRHKEKSVSDDKDFLAPRWINWPTILFFWGKLAAICWAYGILFKFLFQKLT